MTAQSMFYGPTSPAPCRVCGGEMSLVTFVRDARTWRCPHSHDIVHANADARGDARKETQHES